MKKRYRSLMVFILITVLTVTPLEALFVDAATVSGNSGISSNTVSTEMISDSEDTVSKNAEPVSADHTPENETVISVDEAGNDPTVISSDHIENTPETMTESENLSGEITADDTDKNDNEELLDAVWEDYTCKLSTKTNVLTLVSYNKTGSTHLTVPAAADGVRIINGDIEIPYDKTCRVHIGSVSRNADGYWSDRSVWNKTGETLRSLSFEEGVKLNPFSGNIFKGLEKLESLDVSKLDTSDSTYMYSMFGSCQKLTSLDLSGFDTSKVEDMSEMFYGCSSLESLDLSSFDTSETITMTQMFYGCSSLGFLNLGSFDTYNVKNLYEMLYGCSSLRYLNLSHFDLSGSGTDLLTLIKDCTNLKTLITPVTIRSFAVPLSSDLTKPLKRLYLSPSFQGTVKDKMTVINDAGMILYGSLSLKDETDYINAHHEELGITGGDITLVDITVLKDIDNPYSDSYVPEESRVAVTKVALSEDVIELFEDEKIVVKPLIYPSNATNKRVFWSVSNSFVASVSNGIVTGRNAGSTILTVTTEDGDHKANCIISVNEVINPEDDPSAPIHTVIFKNGELILETHRVRSGKTVKMPETVPSKKGYSFLGWRRGESLWNFSTPVFSDLTLTPKFIPASSQDGLKNSGSGLDPFPDISKKTIYIIKGQTCTLGGKNWGKMEDGGIVRISSKTGKLTGLKKGKTVIVNDEKAYYVCVAETELKREAKNISMMVGSSKDIGDKLIIKPVVSGDEIHYPVTWISSNPKIAVVNDGMITALARGRVNITAYVGGRPHVCKVNVVNSYKAPGVLIDKSVSFNMTPLQTISLRYNKEIFDVKGASWSANGMVSTVDKYGMPDGGFENAVVRISRVGRITAVGRGTANLSGRDKFNRTVSVNITVKVIPEKTDTYVTVSRREQLKFNRVVNNRAIWDSSNRNAVPDFRNGRILGGSVGTSTITCSYDPYKSDLPFVFATRAHVEAPEFYTDDGGIRRSMNQYYLELKKGEVYNRIRIKNIYQTVQLKSSKPSVAFVDENGLVYARSKGRANVTARINGKNYKLTVYVTE